MVSVGDEGLKQTSIGCSWVVNGSIRREALFAGVEIEKISPKEPIFENPIYPFLDTYYR